MNRILLLKNGICIGYFHYLRKHNIKSTVILVISSENDCTKAIVNGETYQYLTEFLPLALFKFAEKMLYFKNSVCNNSNLVYLSPRLCYPVKRYKSKDLSDAYSNFRCWSRANETQSSSSWILLATSNFGEKLEMSANRKKYRITCHYHYNILNNYKHENNSYYRHLFYANDYESELVYIKIEHFASVKKCQNLIINSILEGLAAQDTVIINLDNKFCQPDAMNTKHEIREFAEQWASVNTLTDAILRAAALDEKSYFHFQTNHSKTSNSYQILTELYHHDMYFLVSSGRKLEVEVWKSFEGDIDRCRMDVNKQLIIDGDQSVLTLDEEFIQYYDKNTREEDRLILHRGLINHIVLQGYAEHLPSELLRTSSNAIDSLYKYHSELHKLSELFEYQILYRENTNIDSPIEIRGKLKLQRETEVEVLSLPTSIANIKLLVAITPVSREYQTSLTNSRFEGKLNFLESDFHCVIERVSAHFHRDKMLITLFGPSEQSKRDKKLEVFEVQFLDGSKLQFTLQDFIQQRGIFFEIMQQRLSYAAQQHFNSEKDRVLFEELEMRVEVMLCAMQRLLKNQLNYLFSRNSECNRYQSPSNDYHSHQCSSTTVVPTSEEVKLQELREKAAAAIYLSEVHLHCEAIWSSASAKFYDRISAQEIITNNKYDTRVERYDHQDYHDNNHINHKYDNDDDINERLFENRLKRDYHFMESRQPVFEETTLQESFHYDELMDFSRQQSLDLSNILPYMHPPERLRGSAAELDVHNSEHYFHTLDELLRKNDEVLSMNAAFLKQKLVN